jgi:hypothetical protein
MLAVRKRIESNRRPGMVKVRPIVTLDAFYLDGGFPAFPNATGALI